MADEGSRVLAVRVEGTDERHDDDEAGEPEQARHLPRPTRLLRAIRVREAEIRAQPEAEILAIEDECLDVPIEQLPFEMAGEGALAHPGHARQPDDMALVAVGDSAVGDRHSALHGRDARALGETVAVGAT